MRSLCRAAGALPSALLLLSALGCEAAGRSGLKSDPGSTLTVLFPTDERGWAFYVPSQFVVFTPLAIRTSEGRLEGWLAKDWRVSGDHRTWTIHLRPTARWHDGRPVTAHDVRFTLELLSHPAVAMEAPGTFDVVVLDDTTVTVTLKAQHGGWWLDYIPILPRHLLDTLDAASFHAWEFWTRPVGSGPYRYVRHLPGTMMEFEANLDYFRGRPRIERVILRFGQPGVTEMLAGEVDAVPWAREADVVKLRDDPRFHTYHTVKPEHIRAILWNQRDPVLADTRVRGALTMAIDRRALHAALDLPDSLPLFDVLFTRDQYRRGELPEPLPYDTAAAAALLAEAGWRDSDGDGVRERDGRELRIAALTPSESAFARAAVFAQAELRRVGVALEVVTMDAAALAERVKRGDFSGALFVVSNHIHGDDGHLALFGDSSILGFRSPAVAGALQRAARSFDPAEIDSLYRVTVPAFQAELPVTFLYPLVRTTIAHRRVRGLSSPWREDPLWYAGELWLEEGLR